MVKKAIIFFMTTIMLVFGGISVNVSAMSEDEAKDLFFKACDLNNDNVLNVCDLLIAKRISGNPKKATAISKYLSKQPIDYEEEIQSMLPRAINLLDLRLPDSNFTIEELSDKIASSSSTNIKKNQDSSVTMICNYEHSGECFEMYTMSKTTAEKEKIGCTSRYTRNGVSIELFSDKNNMIYFLVDDDTTFPIQLKWKKISDIKTTIKISDQLNNRISEPIVIDFSKEGSQIIPIKFDNNDVYMAILEVKGNSYTISELPKGSKIVK